MFSLLAQADYQSITDVIILPLIILFFGGLFYLLGIRRAWIGEKATWRWIGFGLIILAALAGFGPFWSYVKPGADGDLYRSLYISRKIILGHYVGFLVPCAMILLSGVLEFLYRRRKNFEY